LIGGNETLAQTLVLGSTSGGTNIELTAGDNLLMHQNAPPATGAGQGSFFVGDGTGGSVAGQPYFREESSGALSKLNALGGGETLSATLVLGNTTGGTSVAVTAGDNLFLPQNAPPATGAGQGSFFVGNGTGGTVAGKPYFREESSGAITLLTPTATTVYDFVRENIPNTNQGGNTIVYEGYVLVPCTLSQIVVFMKTLNTAGTYTVTFTNVTTGNTLLSSASFDMQTLTADTWTAMTLTSTGGDLAFAGGNRYRASFVSSDSGFDGTGIYFNLRFTVT
jgi:hypothetical protein